MKKVTKILLIIMVLIIVDNISYAKFITRINGKGKVELKTPILVLENDDLIVGQINKSHNSYQSEFCLKNYIEKTSSINEINFEYSIKLIPSTLNFPVRYSLINVNTNEEISLNDNLETDKISIGKDKIEHKYRLIVSWEEFKKCEDVQEYLDVKIKIKATQI